MQEPYKVRPGGLMRCCLASLDDAMLKAKEPPKEGDRHACVYCKSSLGGTRFRDGAWEWDHDWEWERD